MYLKQHYVNNCVPFLRYLFSLNLNFLIFKMREHNTYLTGLVGYI